MENKESNVIDMARHMIKQVVYATTLAVELFDNNYREADKWMINKNEVFFNNSPIDVILSKEGKHVIKFLEDRLGRGNG